MSNQPFKFKQFTINQDKCAMKVGTDGVLLGAWASTQHQPFSILDIGAGSGLVALMLAQRCNAEVVDALEIDDPAYEQCVSNFENSPWGDRLFCYHASLQEFVTEIDDEYDLIVSNPPFYSEDYKTENEQRDLARFTDAMPFEHLAYSGSKLLSEHGKFVVIIPFKETENFTSLATKYGLHLNEVLEIKGNPNSKIKRSLLEFSFKENTIKKSSLTIEEGRHEYTEEYKKLTQDFYLKM